MRQRACTCLTGIPARTAACGSGRALPCMNGLSLMLEAARGVACGAACAGASTARAVCDPGATVGYG